MSGDEIGKCARARRNDARVEDEGDEGQSHVYVEEGRDFLPAYCFALASALGLRDYPNVPTAVNFDRTCIIMIAVMIRARMCMKSAAPWKIMVFASSIDLE